MNHRLSWRQLAAVTLLGLAGIAQAGAVEDFRSSWAYRALKLQLTLDEEAPLAQATLQVMIRDSKFPEGFADKSRKDLIGRFGTALSIIEKAEADIPAKFWVDIPAATLADDLPLFAAARPASGPARAATDPAREALAALEPDSMTPREALDALYRLKDLAGEE